MESYIESTCTNLKSIISSVIPIVSIERLHTDIVLERVMNYNTQHMSILLNLTTK